MNARRWLVSLFLTVALAPPAAAEVVTIWSRATGVAPIAGIRGLFPGTSSPIPFRLAMISTFDTATGYHFPDYSTMGSRIASSQATLTVGTVDYYFSGESIDAHVQILEHGTGDTTLRHTVVLRMPDGTSLRLSSGIVQDPAQPRFHTVPQMIEDGGAVMSLLYGSSYIAWDKGDGARNVVNPEIRTFEFTAATLVPEPSSYALLVAGLLVLGGRSLHARRRRALRGLSPKGTVP